MRLLSKNIFTPQFNTLQFILFIIYTLTFSKAEPTFSSKERNDSEFLIWPSLVVRPLPNPPNIVVAFSAVVFTTDSVF